MTGRAVLQVITFPLEANAGNPGPTARYSPGRVLINQPKAAATECPESSPIQPSAEQVGKVSGCRVARRALTSGRSQIRT